MKKIDFTLFFTVIILSLFGLFMIYNASSFIAFRDFSDKYHYVKDQLLWLILGFIGLVFFSLFDYKRLYYLFLPILICIFLLLISVFLPIIGVYVLGAHRWINFGFFVLQPSELVKLGLAICLSAWFSDNEKGRFGPACIIIIMIIILVMIEPDMGTAVVLLLESIVIYFLSGGSIFNLFMIIPLIFTAGYIAIKIAPYRAERLLEHMGVYYSIDKTSYHVKQILIALGSGGITGIGFGNSLQKYAYLPENTTDSIFAIIAEEYGLVGGGLLLSVYIFLIWRGIHIAKNTKDSFGKLLSAGIITFLGIQALINLGAQSALIPLTGIPLPFISYGGSATVVNLCSIGILLNISKKI
ncbi:cell division protein FtsW [Candidatus Levyibacteriota bacterium]|nr:stage V sporulation protein E [Candidatus Levybacteria bacterium]GDX61887.1 cell division protein FtsW [Candidatus Levybacteria bacterium]